MKIVYWGKTVLIQDRRLSYLSAIPRWIKSHPNLDVCNSFRFIFIKIGKLSKKLYGLLIMWRKQKYFKNRG